MNRWCVWPSLDRSQVGQFVDADYINVAEGGALIFTNGVLATRQVVAVFSPTSYSLAEPMGEPG